MMHLRMLLRTRTWRRVETIFLGVIFLALIVILYQILTNDHVTVMSWFGITVHGHPVGKIQSHSQSRKKSSVFVRNHEPQLRVSGEDDSNIRGLNHEISKMVISEKNINGTEIVIAIGCALTSKRSQIEAGNLESSVTFLRTFFPSFCKTKPPSKYLYKFYLAYDNHDNFFKKIENRNGFISKLMEIKKILCENKINLEIIFKECPYNSHPAWSQNDAMYAAYLDGADYFYRVNDDTILDSKNWTEIMINVLKSYNPTNVGVTGPAHKGGNDAILVHDFVHKTHVDIFGFYYPRTFPDWYADDWITAVYGSERTRKLESVMAVHTGEKGTRYNHSLLQPAVLGNRVIKDRETVNRFLQVKLKQSPSMQNIKGKAVISMSLYGNDPKYTFGAIRNAQIQPIVFPGWTLRFYVENPHNGQTRYPKVPTNIINKLKSLGSEIIYVDTDHISVPPMMWRFLVADDLKTDIFVVRDADSRLNERDLEIINEWLETDYPFHCVRDHPSHSSYPLFGGLIGGRPGPLQINIGENWQSLMRQYKDGYGMDLEFLSKKIWPRVRHRTLCHDSVSCEQWSNAWPFPSPRKDYAHVGQIFNAYGEPRPVDIDLLKLYREPWACTLRGGESRQSWLMKLDASRKQNKGTALNRSVKISASNVKNIEQEEKESEKSTIPSLARKVVMWSMDYDSRYIRDIKDLLTDRGVVFIDKSLAPDCKNLGVCPHNLSLITPENGMTANKTLANQFYQRYKDDPEMAKVTHFICFHPAAMCEIYESFKKKVIVVATQRYEAGRLSTDRWRDFNYFLLDIEAKKADNIVGANNHYDVEYMRYFTGFDPEYLPNVASYTGITYKPNETEYLIGPIENIEFRTWFLDSLEKMLAQTKSKEKVIYIGNKYPQGFNLTQIASHPGIIIVPRKVSDIFVRELYGMNMPMFFPSLELLSRWQQKHNILRNRTNNAERLEKHGISLKGSPIHPAAMGRFDPNEEDSSMSLRYWLRFADFFNLPHTEHFDSFEHLKELLETVNLRLTSRRLKSYYKRFRSQMITKWINLLNRTLL